MGTKAERLRLYYCEKAKVPRKALVTGGSKVERPVKVQEHTYTKSQTYCDGRKAEGRVDERLRAEARV